MPKIPIIGWMGEIYKFLIEKFGEIKSSKIKKIGKSGNLVNEKFNDTFSNFYMTCSISRSSITMSKPILFLSRFISLISTPAPYLPCDE